MTSDHFFQHSTEFVNRYLPFDLSFIDGIHLFEFVLRYFINTERCSASTSAILLHDCLPINAVTSHRQRTTQLWSGDVWKLLPVLQRYRPDLRVQIFDVTPTGLALVSCLDPESTVLGDHMAEILREYLPMNHEDFMRLGLGAFATTADIALPLAEKLKRSLHHRYVAWRKRNVTAAPPGPLNESLERVPQAQSARPAVVNPRPSSDLRKASGTPSSDPRLLGVPLCLQRRGYASGRYRSAA